MSITVTCAPRPAATLAACVPTMPAAQHQHVRGLHARHAAQQNAPAFEGFLQVLGAFLRSHAAGHLAHRDEQGRARLGSSTVS